MACGFGLFVWSPLGGQGSGCLAVGVLGLKVVGEVVSILCSGSTGCL